jgi:ribosomal protein S18 acetylase RimI-like enzyme
VASAELNVRQATGADLDEAADVLADAFADYEWERWTVAADRHVERIRGLQRLWMERVGLPLGEVWLAEAARGRVGAVAVWMPPGIWIPAEVSAEMAPKVAELEGDRHLFSEAAETICAPLRPASAHYYLGTVGTRRSLHREGLGSAVLAPVLGRADAEAAEAYLETSNEANVAFYRRLGFEVSGEADVPGGGPHVWGMLRQPHRA